MTTTEERPLAVRVLRVAGWIATVVGAVVAVAAFVKGASEDFEDLAAAWALVMGLGILLFLAGVTALLAGIRNAAGLAFGLVSCAIMLVLLPVGTAVTIAVGVIASQTWPQVRDYYRVTRRAA